ncbi:hypothetical protein [Enterococcus phage Phi_Eg_SY1]|nr:hypothetical protein [Enterococcus phage Phi_Eg_SY1]
MTYHQVKKVYDKFNKGERTFTNFVRLLSVLDVIPLHEVPALIRAYKKEELK